MKKILDKLKEIERHRKIEILHACETGSRAWGFASPDSDYDIRFIYKHERDWYMSLNTPKDSLELMDGDLDVTGWELKKCLKLLKKSNVPLIERFQSPVVYYTKDGFHKEFRQLIESYYSPIASYYHHYSLAVKFWEEIKDRKEIKLKGYFYLLRSLLSCNWIVNDHSVLPMHMHGLLKYVGDREKELIKELTALKMSVGESYWHVINKDMVEMVTSLFDFIGANKNNLGVNNMDYVLLNEFFIRTINGNADN